MNMIVTVKKLGEKYQEHFNIIKYELDLHKLIDVTFSIQDFIKLK